MFSALCPSCGATVSLRASQSTTAVCGFCRSTLVRRADALERIGVQGELLEDHSRVQLGTGGRFDGRGFTTIGRIQLRYDDGGWNEWYLLFDDGGTGWLSEASGQYAVTFERGTVSGAPSFDALRPGMTAGLRGQRYVATDRRTARCTAAEGELPFPADSRWEAKVVDLRDGDALATLDWSHGEPPVLYAGRAVALESLQPTLLRGLAQTAEAAGALGAALQSLACPSCGAPVRFVSQLATHVTCRQCKSELSGRDADLVTEVQRVDASERRTALALGDTGRFDDEAYTVIGVLARRAEGDDTEWFEYLLWSPKAGFRWLVEVAGAWQWVEVLNALPEEEAGGARLGDQRFLRLERYDAVTTWVAGSFNWRPRVGDRAEVTEFERRAGGVRTVLSRERTDDEVTWSRATELPAARLAEAFGRPVGAAAAPPASGARAGATEVLPEFRQRSVRDLAWLFSILLALAALPAVFMADFDDLIAPLVIAYLALWLPLRMLGDGDRGG